MGDLYIGLMSGTSIDSVDAVIADLSQKKPLVVSQENFEIPKNLRFQTLQLINQKKPKEPHWERLGLQGSRYFNAGVKLIKLQEWKKANPEKPMQFFFYKAK